MSLDTTAINRRTRLFDGDERIWLFGYGSLIYKVDFRHRQLRPAHVEHWVRRYWQGSHDHRGTAQAPGRVLTLVPAPGQRCAGMAYLIDADVLSALDAREKNGYLRSRIELRLSAIDGAAAEVVSGLTYVAPAGNAAWLGPAPEPQIAKQIAAAHGPSGSNRDYALELAAALRRLGEHDEHVFAIERHLLAVQGPASSPRDTP